MERESHGRMHYDVKANFYIPAHCVCSCFDLALLREYNKVK